MSEAKFVHREVPADLIESTPGIGGIGYWLLASPWLIFLAWLWVDLVHLFSPLPYWPDVVIGLILFVLVIVLPFGVLAHRLVLSFPRLFHNAGWDLEPLEAVKLAEQYLVRYRYQQRHWASNSWRRTWLRAAQGWVFLEIAAILIGAVAMIPLFFSVSEFGFGR
ncbi:MAG: hypothetical protein U0350_16310 [Caldilineaceae bacterium]